MIARSNISSQQKRQKRVQILLHRFNVFSITQPDFPINEKACYWETFVFNEEMLTGGSRDHDHERCPYPVEKPVKHRQHRDVDRENGDSSADCHDKDTGQVCGWRTQQTQHWTTKGTCQVIRWKSPTLSNLWCMPNLVSKSFRPAFGIISSSGFQQYPTTHNSDIESHLRAFIAMA